VFLVFCILTRKLQLSDFGCLMLEAAMVTADEVCVCGLWCA